MTKFIQIALFAAPLASALTVKKHTEKHIIIIKKPVDCSSCPTDDSTSSCFLPGSTDSNYVECSNGQPTEMSCASGLVWNQDLETCDYPSNPDSSSDGSSSKQWFNICNMCKFYPNQYGSCYMPSFNPTKYITCANGQAYSQSCPSGLVWQQRQETCNWPKGSRTNYGSSSSDADSAVAPAPAPKTNFGKNKCDECTPNEYGTCFMPDEKHDHFYYECSNGAPTHKMCPNNLVWNQDLETCDWPSTSSDSSDQSTSFDLNVCSMCVFLENEYGSCFVPSLNPKKYITCDNGEPTSQECPSGTVWIEKEQTCDFPRWTQYKDNHPSNTDSDSSDDNSGKEYNNWVCNMCVFYKNQYGSCYMPSWNPTKYIQCDNGDAVVQECSPGLVWNQWLQTCDWPKTNLGKKILGDATN